QLLASCGATADLDPVDTAVLAVARGESVRLPHAPPPSLGNPRTEDFGWILGQFALLGRTAVVQALLDSGMPVDTRGWSNFTPLDQAAMHGRTETVRLLIERGSDLHDCAFDDGPHAVGLRHVGVAEQPGRGRRLSGDDRDTARGQRTDAALATHR
ncbi:MAG: ankyrin repeat domain-containing protein, partial [Nocardioidaceae bacterium]